MEDDEASARLKRLHDQIAIAIGRFYEREGPLYGGQHMLDSREVMKALVAVTLSTIVRHEDAETRLASFQLVVDEFLQRAAKAGFSFALVGQPIPEDTRLN